MGLRSKISILEDMVIMGKISGGEELSSGINTKGALILYLCYITLSVLSLLIFDKDQCCVLTLFSVT